MRKLLAFLFIIALMPLGAVAEEQAPDGAPEVGIIEHLGGKIPLDVTLMNEEGQQVKVGDVIDKPVILNFVYYTCPGICSPLLNSLTKTLDKMLLKPGEDYEVLTVSFDPNDTPEIAKAKKANYLGLMERQTDYPPEAWHWMTGSEEEVRRLTDAVGFGYMKQDGEYIHSGAIMAIADDGKIIRYLYGTEFLPFDVKLAISEAYKGEPGPTITKLLQYCYSYDPEGRKYSFNILRVIGVTMTLTAVGFFAFLVYTGRQNNLPQS